jgi:hypothetical protein
LSAFEVPQEAIRAAAEAVSGKRWRGGPRWAAHASHQFDGGCAVCQGDVEAIVAVAVEAAGPLIAEHIARRFEDRAAQFRQIGKSGKSPDGQSLTIGQGWNCEEQAMEMDAAARIVRETFKGADRG